MGSGKHVLVGDAHWRNLVNTTEPSTCDGDAAFCQITLTTFTVLERRIQILHSLNGVADDRRGVCR